jgi:hypothetical protein
MASLKLVIKGSLPLKHYLRRLGVAGSLFAVAFWFAPFMTTPADAQQSPGAVFKMIGGTAGLASACDNNLAPAERLNKFFAGSGASVADDLSPITMAAFKKAILEHVVSIDGKDIIVECSKWKAVSVQFLAHFNKLLDEMEK